MLVNMGTLLAFLIVCAAVLIMRRTHPHAERPFRVPFVPLIPILGILSCLLLMFSLPSENWWRLLIGLGLGMLIYFLYGRKHSGLQNVAQELSRHGASPAGHAVNDTNISS
jgi:APA family basic amino acid/polyamine antiporter